MTRLLAVVAGSLLAVRAGASPHVRDGQVVRVERSPHGLSGTPRYCRLQADPLSGVVSGDCFGPAPQAGDRIVVLDTTHVIATARVTRPPAHTNDACSDAEWLVEAVQTSGQGAWESEIGLIDVPVDPRAGRIELGARPSAGSSEWTIGVDRDGDGDRIVEFVGFQCDDNGEPTTHAATSSCIEVRVPTAHGPERLRVDRSRNCY